MFGKAAINPQRYPHREPIHRPGDLRYLSLCRSGGDVSRGGPIYIGMPRRDPEVPTR
jgi:hypothetical protein